MLTAVQPSARARSSALSAPAVYATSRSASSWSSSSDDGGHDREEGNALEHDEGRDDPPRALLRGDVSVAERRHRLQRPPHALPDTRVLVPVEQPHENAPDEDDDEGRDDDHIGCTADGERIAPEARYLWLDAVRASHARDRNQLAAQKHRPIWPMRRVATSP
jgi:hypothetical protein